MLPFPVLARGAIHSSVAIGLKPRLRTYHRCGTAPDSHRTSPRASVRSAYGAPIDGVKLADGRASSVGRGSFPRVPLALHDLPHPTLPVRSDWVPPPRFGTVHFDAYHPFDDSQAQARSIVERFIEPLPQRRWWQRAAAKARPGLYLDGGFGVGKTHLMAAAWHASAESRKIYLSFAELVAIIGVLGMERASVELAREALVCIDEFELDDPGNTLIVKSFLGRLFERGGRAITTSNTAPQAQGAGRFDAASFQREIQSIAAYFDVVAIDGPDHRRHAGLDEHAPLPSLTSEPPAETVVCSWAELHQALQRLHPVRYGSWVRHHPLWIVRGVERIPDQQTALRFVHFIDKLYDQAVPILLEGQLPINQLFDSSYAGGAYAKKHLRAQSRIVTLGSEALARLQPGNHQAAGSGLSAIS